MMTWYHDNGPAPTRIPNSDNPVTVVPRDDGSCGLQFGGDPEIFGNFPSATLAHTYARSRWTNVQPLQATPTGPEAVSQKSLRQRLSEAGVAP